MSPLIILIPHFNDLNGLFDSILSIKEKFSVDVLVIDDGSRMPPEEEVLKKMYRNGKVFLHLLKKNKGIEYALNYGLKEIQKKKYQYIARLDCGDYCEKNRFLLQMEFLKQNVKIGLVGSYVNFINTEKDLIYKLQLPNTDKIIRKKMYLNAMLIHPSIMFRIEVIEKIGLYPTQYEAAEDYAFFFKVIKKFDVANLPMVLVNCTIDPEGISGKRRKKQVKSRIRIILDNFYFGFYPIYGLLRNIVLLCIPRNMATKLKKVTFK